MQEDSEIYYPMLIPDGDDYDAVRLWAEFNQLPIRFRDILTSRELPQILRRIQTDYGLDETVILQISRLLRWLFFQKLTWEEFGMRIESVLFASQGHGERVQELLARMKQEILGMNPTQYEEESEETSTETQGPIIDTQHLRYLPLLKALAAYPELHYQRMTNEKINIKGEREPVAPTVRNWMRAYRDELGVGQHTTVERGQFLFQSANTKALSTPEREIVALMIKSLEEEEPLAVDTLKKVLVFQVAKPMESTTETPSPTPETSASSLQFDTDFEMAEEPPAPPTPGELSFSSGHQLPGEQDAWGPRKES